MAKNLPKLPTEDAAFHALLSAEQSTVVKCSARLSFSRCVYRGNKSGTIRNSLQRAIREPVRMSQGAASCSLGKRGTAEKPSDFRPLLPLHLKKPTTSREAADANRVLASVLPGLFVGACGEIETTVKVLSGQYKTFGHLSDDEIDREGLPVLDQSGHALSVNDKRILLRRILSLFQGMCVHVDILLSSCCPLNDSVNRKLGA